MLKRKLVAIAVGALIVAVALWSMPSQSADAATTAFAQQVKGALSPADRAWVVQEGGAVLRAPRFTAAAVASRVNSQFAGRKYEPQTLEALMATVYAEAAARAAIDGQAIVDAIAAGNRQKEALRKVLEHVQDSGCVDELNQELALKMQQLHTRQTQAQAMLSDIVKRNHDALQAIVANLKG